MQIVMSPQTLGHFLMTKFSLFRNGVEEVKYVLTGASGMEMTIGYTNVSRMNRLCTLLVEGSLHRRIITRSASLLILPVFLLQGKDA